MSNDQVCRDCVFAIYQNKTQICCEFNRIEKFDNVGAEVIEAYDEYATEFFVIKDRQCNAYRNQEWGQLVDKDKWKDIVNKQIKHQYDVIILTNEDTTPDDIIKTVVDIKNQTIEPHLLIVSMYADNPDIILTTMNYLKTTSLQWKLESVGDSSKNLLDEAVKSAEGVFYCAFWAGCNIEKDFIAKLDKMVNDELKQIVLIEPDEFDNGLVVCRKVHIMLEGNDNDNIINKIKKERGLSDWIIQKN